MMAKRSTKVNGGIMHDAKAMLGIPPFLVVTPAEAERRKEHWINNPPKPITLYSHSQIDERIEEAARIRRLAEIDKRRKKDEQFDKMKAKPKPVKPAKVPFGAGIKLKLVDGASRKPGTGAATRFIAMQKYMKKHPKATVEEVLRETPYRKDDYLWDLKKGNIKADV